MDGVFRPQDRMGGMRSRIKRSTPPRTVRHATGRVDKAYQSVTGKAPTDAWPALRPAPSPEIYLQYYHERAELKDIFQTTRN